MYRVQLENFQGPLDLLLYFIRRDEIDIYDIPIAHITREFVQALDLMQALNLALAGEFVEMAATLMRIKARMLLPRLPADELEEVTDPRRELVQQLLEYQRFKEAAGTLLTLAEHRHQFFPLQVPQQPGGELDDTGAYLREITLFDLALIFKTAMEKMPVITPYEMQREQVSLDDQKALILRSFDSDGRLRFSKLIAGMNTRQELIVAFLAILELVRQEQIRVFQNALFDDLELILTVNRS